MPQCNVCQSIEVCRIIKIDSVPIFNNILLESFEDAINIPRGDIDLSICHNCGHFFNSAFLPHLIDYTHKYENSLHFSPRFRKYADDLIEDLVEEYDLRGKRIVEIGCGQGDFLKSICHKGGNYGKGYDPSYRGKTIIGNNKNIVFVQDEFSIKYADRESDFIYSRHVLEHVPYPYEFVSELRQIIGNRLSIRVFIDVPNLRFTLEDLGIWDLIYEHCSYFSANSLDYLIDSAGFSVEKLVEVFDGQFLQIFAIPKDPKNKAERPLRDNNWNTVDKLQILASSFAINYDQKVKYWNSLLESFRKERRRVVVWGAGSKGVSFLNIFKNHGAIEFAVDINPNKIDKYIAGAGQRIVHPDFLKEIRPDIVIVMNQVYENEIRDLLRDMDISVEFLFA